jgi:restriction system protein
LFDASTFVSDDDLLWSLNHQPEKLVELQDRYEYFRRLPLTAFGVVHAQAGVRWALDLLPDSPGQAITVIKSYSRAHITSLTSGRKDGLRDAIDIIYAYYINRTEETRQEALMYISPRQFELLVAHLYRRMGFSVMVTRPTRDGGRDVIATKSGPGEKQKLLIECKQYLRPVTVKEARALLGVVGHENASGGVVVTVGRCTRGVHQLANADDRFECIDGGNLVFLLNKYFGTDWPQHLNWLADPTWAVP